MIDLKTLVALSLGNYTKRYDLLIQGLPPDPPSNVYPHDRFSIQALHDAVPRGMTDMRASIHYVGPDLKLNEQHLRDEYRRVYKGVDVLSIVNGAFNILQTDTPAKVCLFQPKVIVTAYVR